MKKFITLILLGLIIVSCNSVKRNQKFIARGEYDRAIEFAIKKLEKDKTSSKSDAHIILLEDAFKKAVQEDIRRINFFKKENNPDASRNIYYLYRGLIERQYHLRPILPLYSISLGRNAKFKLVDYSDKIIEAKQKFLTYLYDIGKRYMNFDKTLEYRKAYTIYCELTDIQSNYKDSKELLNDAHFYGTDFIFVTIKNQSFQIIPYSLKRELLNFNTYGLDDFWTEYHSKKEHDINYNFGIILNFRSIEFSPERISEREYIRKKSIKDGWEYKRDRYGNLILDEDGKRIKIDKFKIVTAVLLETIQTKSVFIAAIVQYLDLQKEREINYHPLESEFFFENIYASYRGDERALTTEDKELINNHFISYPNNAQILLDAGEDVKLQLKEILKGNSFR